MTAVPVDRERAVDASTHRGDGIRRDHLRAVPPVSAPERPGPADSGWQLSEILAPFVAWLATQDLGESERWRHRDAAERFLRWSHTDTGRVEDRRRRYEWHVRQQDPGHFRDAQAGLTWWTQHRWIVSCTLPTDC